MQTIIVLSNKKGQHQLIKISDQTKVFTKLSKQNTSTSMTSLSDPESLILNVTFLNRENFLQLPIKAYLSFQFFNFKHVNQSFQSAMCV